MDEELACTSILMIVVHFDELIHRLRGFSPVYKRGEILIEENGIRLREKCA